MARHAPTNEPKSSDLADAADNGNEVRGKTRGRTRTTRSMGGRLSLDEEDAISTANQTRDAALNSLANEDPTVASGPDDTRSSIEIGRRALATPSMRRDTTGLDLADDSVFGDLGDSFADGEIPQAPLSANSSMTLSNFKTRPRSRQSSIIGRNDPPIRPSSRGGNTPGVSSSFNIGVFRRRARQPSILGATRQPRSETGSVAGNSDLESEGEFAPEAESTPLNSRRQSRRRSQQQQSRDVSVEPPRRSTRKRKSDNAEDTASPRPEKVSRVESDGGMDVNSDSELSNLASPSPPAARRLPRPMTPVNLDEITAPPASSDSEAEDNVWPDIHTLAKRRRRPSVATPVRHEDAFSDVSSPPSLTHSPNLAEARAARARAAAKRQRSPNVTTADLTNLLPKRRYKRNRDEFDIDSDGEADASDQDEEEEEDDDDDGDEPSYGDDRSSRRRKGGRPPSRAASRAGRANNSVLKPKQTPVSVRRSTRSNKTYRTRGEDKENESDGDDENDDSQFHPLPDNTFDMTADAQNAAELQQASKKFKEVDKWELEFEEVAEPPSPENAR